MLFLRGCSTLEAEARPPAERDRRRPVENEREPREQRKGEMTMKKMMALVLAMILALACTACANKCKECDNEVYKDGYCEYHYALKVAGDAVDGLVDSIFG